MNAENEWERRKHRNPLARHAIALGELCIRYRFLEEAVETFFEIMLAKLSEEERKVILNQTDLLKELAIMRGLGFIKKPDDKWYVDLDLVVWAIETNIVPRRNRFIHDRWVKKKFEAVYRRRDRTRIARPQAGEDQELITRFDRGHS